jgi:molybdate transport system substrate-binding protein
MMATITTIAGGAPKPVFDRIVPVFEQRTGHKVNALYDTMSGIKGRVAKGDTLDVLLMPVPMLDDFERSGVARKEGRAPLAVTTLGVGVKNGTAVPDLSTPDRVREALRGARSIVFAPPSATPSGEHSDWIVRQLGLSDELAGRIIHKAGLAGGVAAIASGEAALGMFPKSEIVAFDGVTLTGPLPDELQMKNTYGAAVMTVSQVPGPAADFIRFLTEPESLKVWIACGFDPPGA